MAHKPFKSSFFDSQRDFPEDLLKSRRIVSRGFLIRKGKRVSPPRPKTKRSSPRPAFTPKEQAEHLREFQKKAIDIKGGLGKRSRAFDEELRLIQRKFRTHFFGAEGEKKVRAVSNELLRLRKIRRNRGVAGLALIIGTGLAYRGTRPKERVSKRPVGRPPSKKSVGRPKAIRRVGRPSLNRRK